MAANPAMSSYWDYTPGGKSTASKAYQACYHTHPGLVIKEGGNAYTIYGGNCMNPVVTDADIYIGFAGSVRGGSALYPWQDGYKTETIIDFYIQDMTAPKDAVEFYDLVVWTATQLLAGKKIHAGCIGGHGRTGTFFAALVAFMTGRRDAIQYVRKHYCKKAVENHVQIQFLMDEYGVDKAAETKKAYVSKSGKASAYPSASQPGLQFAGAARKIKPVGSAKCVWGSFKQIPL